MRNHSVVVTGGGTGGHATPAIAIADELKRQDSDINVHYIGGYDSLEQRLAIEHGFKFHPVWISSLRRGRILNNLKLLLMIPVSLIQAIYYLLRYRVCLVIGTGGFASFPACTAARLLRRAVVLQDQNSYPGMVTRLMASYATLIYLGFKEAENHLNAKSDKFLITGNPTSFEHAAKRGTDNRFDLDRERTTIFVTGGSGGALSINRVIDEIKGDLIERDYNLIWQTGKHWDGSIEVPEDSKKRMIIKRFYNSDEMRSAYNSADFVVSRCGAITLAELALMGIPAILIPFPYSAEGHQEANGRAVAKAGAAKLLLNADLTRETLLEAIGEMSDQETLKGMSENMRKLAKQNAAREIVNDCMALIK